MTEELYERLETDAAKSALLALSKHLPEPFVVLGGWAVYLTVTDSFKDAQGSSYLGSRDVDLGFHIDVTATPEQLRKSNYAKALKMLEELGYSPSGMFRYCKILDKESGQILSETESRTVPTFNLFYLYVDPMVDKVHPRHHDVFKIEPMDEPLLERVLLEELLQEKRIEDARILVPEPYMLIATKMKAIPSRQKDEKRMKDACDIYALLWHSPISYQELIGILRREYPDLCKGARTAINDEVAREAAKHIGIDVEQYIGVINGLNK